MNTAWQTMILESVQERLLNFLCVRNRKLNWQQSFGNKDMYVHIWIVEFMKWKKKNNWQRRLCTKRGELRVKEKKSEIGWRKKNRNANEKSESLLDKEHQIRHGLHIWQRIFVSWVNFAFAFKTCKSDSHVFISSWHFHCIRSPSRHCVAVQSIINGATNEIQLWNEEKSEKRRERERNGNTLNEHPA